MAQPFPRACALILPPCVDVGHDLIPAQIEDSDRMRVDDLYIGRISVDLARFDLYRDIAAADRASSYLVVSLTLSRQACAFAWTGIGPIAITGPSAHANHLLGHD